MKMIALKFIILANSLMAQYSYYFASNKNISSALSYLKPITCSSKVFIKVFLTLRNCSWYMSKLLTLKLLREMIIPNNGWDFVHPTTFPIPLAPRSHQPDPAVQGT